MAYKYIYSINRLTTLYSSSIISIERRIRFSETFKKEKYYNGTQSVARDPSGIL